MGRILCFALVLALPTIAPCGTGETSPASSRPNIVFILADDLGYGDLGCYGQKKIRTPNIDRLASEGMRFTQCYAGSTVCAPSRSVLMTGQHTGHTRVRGNMCKVGGSVGYKGKRKVRRMYLTDEDRTVGHLLRDAGYRTCLINKWHLGAYLPDATPLDRGFDEFYGRLMLEPDTQRPVYFPVKRFRNRETYELTRNQGGRKGLYLTDLCTDEAIAFIRRHKKQPFFLFLSYTVPHSPYDPPPDLGIYGDRDWEPTAKNYAAMIGRLDRNVGRLMAELKKLGVDERTIVFFTSDNGPRSEAQPHQTATVEFFDSNGPLRGYKRDMFEGGIRVPMIARWPGRTPAGKTSDAVWSFADVLPTAADLAGAKPPANVDGISVLPTLLGERQDTADRFLYWEFYERGFQQAVRWKNWKAVRSKPGQPLLLFDLSTDLGEAHDVAAQHPAIVEEIENYLKTARTESPNWPTGR